LRGIAVQVGAVVTCGPAAVGSRGRNNFKLLAALVNPKGEKVPTFFLFADRTEGEVKGRRL
jgi:hypothetical protein